VSSQFKKERPILFPEPIIRSILFLKTKSERQSQYEKENKTGLMICKTCNTEKKLIFE